MKTKLVIAFAMLFVVIIINSCEDKVGVVPFVPTVIAGCNDTDVTYSSGTNTLQAIINTNCATAGCHSSTGSAPTDFTNYAGLQTDATGGKSSQIYNHLFIKQDMPLGKPPLDQCSLDKFNTWLLAGAPQ